MQRSALHDFLVQYPPWIVQILREYEVQAVVFAVQVCLG